MDTIQTKVRPALMELKVGETATFPIEKMKTVRTQASEIGAIYDRVLTTSTDRVARTISVKRLPNHSDDNGD